MKNFTILLSLLFVFLFIDMSAQPFEQVTASITGVGRSTVSWGDYDNDGDLDFALCGMTSSGSYLSRIYENVNGNFAATDAVLQGIKDGSVSWGDFDNDDDLDLLLTGETENNGNISLIYINTDGNFTEFDAGLSGVGYGDGIWGDYDNDGDLDILIVGNWMVEIYENTDGIFTLTENDLGQLQNAKGTWGDFDNDGDLDILLSGDTGGGYFTDVFLNDMGIFTPANLGMTGQFSGSTDLIDFDNDGDLDISVTGFDIYLDPLFRTYTNNGDGTISVNENYMEGIATGSVDWGDYDNDGDLDILMCGKTAACGGSVSKVYNNDNGSFIMDDGASLTGAIRSNPAWADFDNDGDLDFILSGMTASEVPFTYLYMNTAGHNQFVTNTHPTAPVGLEAVVDGQTVIFIWEKASDLQTPQDGLNYNLRLGTSPGGNDILTPMSNVASGYRTIQAIGNTNAQNSWIVSKLQPGTYYWSVQTIDQAYCGSEFAEEGSFMIIATGVNDFKPSSISQVFPNPANNKIFVQSSTSSIVAYKIYNVNGQQLLFGTASSGQAIDISSLKEGIFFIHLHADDELSIQRLIKQ